MIYSVGHVASPSPLQGVLVTGLEYVSIIVCPVSSFKSHIKKKKKNLEEQDQEPNPEYF